MPRSAPLKMCGSGAGPSGFEDRLRPLQPWFLDSTNWTMAEDGQDKLSHRAETPTGADQQQWHNAESGRCNVFENPEPGQLVAEVASTSGRLKDSTAHGPEYSLLHGDPYSDCLLASWQLLEIGRPLSWRFCFLERNRPFWEDLTLVAPNLVARLGRQDQNNMTLHTVSFPVLPIVNTHLIINCVLVFFTLVVVGLRILARYINGAKLWWDDWIILFCVPQGIGMLVIQGLCKS